MLPSVGVIHRALTVGQKLLIMIILTQCPIWSGKGQKFKNLSKCCETAKKFGICVWLKQPLLLKYYKLVDVFLKVLEKGGFRNPLIIISVCPQGEGLF